MEFKKIALIALALSLVACGNDNSSSIEELEAAQAGVEILDHGDLKSLDRAPVTADMAQKICLFEMNQAFSSEKDDSVIQQACDCIVSNVGLTDFAKAIETEREAGVPFENRGIVFDLLEADQALLSNCAPFL